MNSLRWFLSSCVVNWRSHRRWKKAYGGSYLKYLGCLLRNGATDMDEILDSDK